VIGDPKHLWDKNVNYLIVDVNLLDWSKKRFGALTFSGEELQGGQNGGIQKFNHENEKPTVIAIWHDGCWFIFQVKDEDGILRCDICFFK